MESDAQVPGDASDCLAAASPTPVGAKRLQRPTSPDAATQTSNAGNVHKRRRALPANGGPPEPDQGAALLLSKLDVRPAPIVTCAQVKQALRSRGLRSSGRMSVLEARLRKAAGLARWEYTVAALEEDPVSIRQARQHAVVNIMVSQAPLFDFRLRAMRLPSLRKLCRERLLDVKAMGKDKDAMITALLRWQAERDAAEADTPTEARSSSHGRSVQFADKNESVTYERGKPARQAGCSGATPVPWNDELSEGGDADDA